MLYADDVILATNSVEFKSSFFKAQDDVYGSKHGGTLQYFLDFHVKQQDGETYIHQTKYCKEVLQRFGYGDVHSCTTPMETNVGYIKTTGPLDGYNTASGY